MVMRILSREIMGILLLFGWISGCSLVVGFDQKSKSCGNGAIDEGEECDPSAAIYDVPQDLCSNGALPECVDCKWKCPACGNGKLDDGEMCDGDAWAAEVSCEPNTYPVCRADCSNFDCQSLCGNGELDAGETCDPSMTEENRFCREVTGDYFGNPVCSPSCDAWTGCYAGLLYGDITDDFAVDMVADPEGNLYVIGTTGGYLSTSAEDPGTSYGGTDIVMMKIGARGSVEWARQVGSSQNDKAVALAMDSQNGYLYALGQVEIPGNTQSENTHDICIFKVTWEGEILELRCYDGNVANSMNKSDDIAADIVVDGGGYVYVSGSTNAKVFDGRDLGVRIGQMDALLIKLNPETLDIERSAVHGTVRNDIGGGLVNIDEYIYWSGAISGELQITSSRVFLEKRDHDLILFGGEEVDIPFGSTRFVKPGPVAIDGQKTPENNVEIYLAGTFDESDGPSKSYFMKINDTTNGFSVNPQKEWGQEGIRVRRVALDGMANMLWVFGTTGVGLTDFGEGKLGMDDAFLAGLMPENLDTQEVHYFGSSLNDQGSGLVFFLDGTACMAGSFSEYPDASLNFDTGGRSNLFDIAVWCRPGYLPMK